MKFVQQFLFHSSFLQHHSQICSEYFSGFLVLYSLRYTQVYFEINSILPTTSDLLRITMGLLHVAETPFSLPSPILFESVCAVFYHIISHAVHYPKDDLWLRSRHTDHFSTSHDIRNLTILWMQGKVFNESLCGLPIIKMTCKKSVQIIYLSTK